MSNIHKSASIDNSTKIGFHSVVMRDVVIGKDCQIGINVIIYEGTKIGDNVRIDDNAVIGKKPMISPRSIFKVEKSLRPAEIGDNCLIGTNVIIYAQCKMGQNNLVADLATIRENVELGNFNIVGRGVAIENFCKIGNKNKFETNSYITAYSEVGDYCFIAPCVATSNDNFMGRGKERFNHFKGVVIENGGRIGVNSTILPGIKIAADTAIAAGSVVTKNTSTGKFWMGVPARELKDVPENQLLKNNLDKKK